MAIGFRLSPNGALAGIILTETIYIELFSNLVTTGDEGFINGSFAV